ncbi:MAG: hypothetical protein PHY34_06520 [Patescibacteria group bacterium]|nr:hypothetical protein [Patescibacteria group bacterium]
MKDYTELARNRSVGNILRCPCGVVHINIRGISLHFTDEIFLEFSSLVGKASSSLMDIGISGLMKGEN